MVSQPAYLRNLKAFTKRRWDDPEASRAAANSLRSESDRGAIILSATTLEDMLEHKIIHFMPNLAEDETARKDVFERDGPISSFSRKLLIAYALGIVDKPYRNKIDLIREIRNACAHSRNPVSFDTPELREACKVVIGDMVDDLPDDNPASLRKAFIFTVDLISYYVATGQKVEGREARIQHVRRMLGGA